MSLFIPLEIMRNVHVATLGTNIKSLLPRNYCEYINLRILQGIFICTYILMSKGSLIIQSEDQNLIAIVDG